MKESSDSPIKNNCLSSDLLKFKGLYNIHDGINGQFKENKNIDKNSTQYNQLSETHLQKNLSSSLIQFMENQDKKHLSTNFNHQNVKKFLEEKEKAMEKIIFEDEPMDEKNENDNEDKKLKVKDKSKSVKFKKEKDEKKIKIQNDSKNENNNILIFHGTFGEEKFDEIMKTPHHHRHSHHHHHHHHHHENENKSKFAFEC
jgi:hypothetical protein